MPDTDQGHAWADAGRLRHRRADTRGGPQEDAHRKDHAGRSTGTFIVTFLLTGHDEATDTAGRAGGEGGSPRQGSAGGCCLVAAVVGDGTIDVLHEVGWHSLEPFAVIPRRHEQAGSDPQREIRSRSHATCASQTGIATASEVQDRSDCIKDLP